LRIGPGKGKAQEKTSMNSEPSREPATVAAFLELVRKSGLVEDKRLAAYLEKPPADADLPVEAAQMASLMVRDGLLTQFQADQLLAGKWKRFTIGPYRVLEFL